MTFRRAAPAALLLVAAPALADDKDARIERLEKETAELKKELAELKASKNEADGSALRAAVDDYLAHRDETPSAGTYAGPGGVRRPGGGVTLGGYFSTKFVDSHAKEDGAPAFVDARVVPQIHADITKNIALNTEIEFEEGGITDEHGGEVSVEYAELSFRWSDAFTFKAGDLLVPFGWFNQNHDDPMNDLSSRPNVARFVVPSAFDSPGVGAMGKFDVTDDAALTYDVVLVNGFSDEISADEGLRTARTNSAKDDDHDKTVFGRVGFVPTVSFLDALNVGVSGARGAVGKKSDRLTGFGADASAKSGPWEFKGELDQFGIERHGEAPPIDSAGRLGPVRGVNGWYAQILYRFTDSWVRSLPFSEKDASVALVLRRDRVDLNDRVHGASPGDDERAWSFGVTYRPTTRTAVKLEYRRATSGAQGDAGRDRDLIAVEFATYF